MWYFWKLHDILSVFLNVELQYVFQMLANIVIQRTLDIFTISFQRWIYISQCWCSIHYVAIQCFISEMLIQCSCAVRASYFASRFRYISVNKICSKKKLLSTDLYLGIKYHRHSVLNGIRLDLARNETWTSLHSDYSKYNLRKMQSTLERRSFVVNTVQQGTHKRRELGRSVGRRLVGRNALRPRDCI